MSCVETRLEGGVLTLTLADVDNRNALSDALKAQLAQAIDRAEADPAIRVVVLTNRGKTFCAGADLRQKRDSDAGAPKVGVPDLLLKIRRSPKPFVGRIAGREAASANG